ncbi:hypothetical protein D3C83_14340 [compost metagenome]
MGVFRIVGQPCWVAQERTVEPVAAERPAAGCDRGPDVEILWMPRANPVENLRPEKMFAAIRA